jgi:hypothetical protein
MWGLGFACVLLGLLASLLLPLLGLLASLPFLNIFKDKQLN